jgi:uncharacterized membrane protein
MSRNLSLKKQQIPHLILIFFGVLIFTMGILNHYFFRTFNYDYCTYNFALWDYSHFRISPMTTVSGTFLQDHFSFTLMYFVPVYWLLNWITGTYTLILIQCSLIILSAWYTCRIVRLRSDSLWLSAGVLIYYFTLLGRYTAFVCDVNIEIIVSCFIPIFVYYFYTRKYLISALIFFLSLLSRENIPLWFIFIFVTLAVQQRKDKKAVILSMVGITICIAYFILVFKFLIPAIETSERPYVLFNYSALGNDPGSAFAFIMQHPLKTFSLLFSNHLPDSAYDWVKTEFYWVYLVSGGFILLLKPQYLIWFIPVIAQKVLNDSPIRWGIASYYSIEVVTLLPLSVFLTLSELKRATLRNGLIAVTCAATLATTIHKLNPRNCILPWTVNPAKQQIYSKRFFSTPFNISKVRQLLARIPATAKVSASDRFCPHLAQRKSIYIFPTVKDADYIVFSVFDNFYVFSHEQNELNRNKYLSDPEWSILAQEFPVFLLKRTAILTADEQNHLTPQIKFRENVVECSYESSDKEKGFALFSNQEKADPWADVSTSRSRSGSHSLLVSPERRFNTAFCPKDINKMKYLSVSVWSLCTAEQAHVVASIGKNFYLESHAAEEVDPAGWKRLSLNFWIPRHLNRKRLRIYLWNSGTQPAYFDDLQLIEKY